MPKGEKGRLAHKLRPRRLLLRVESILGEPIRVHHAFRARRDLFIRWVVMALSVGVVTGAFVAAFDVLLRDRVVPLLYGLRNPWAYSLLPPVGLVLAVLATRYFVPSRESALTEDYILVYHDDRRHMRLGNLPGKMVASFFTLALGGSMGLEGPSIYFGATAGDSLQRRFKRLFRREDLKLLLVAGGAAGMAAIFKAPLTGVIFAMETPFLDSLAARALVPALLSSSASYLTFVLLVGAEPLFAQSRALSMGPSDMAMFLLLGLACGVGARLFVWMTRRVKTLFDPLPPLPRAALSGLLVGGLGTATYFIFGEPYVYGPGYRIIQHLLGTTEPFYLILLLLGAKMAATTFTVGGGGVGGLFFPMAVMGTIMGSGFSHFAPGGHATAYAIIGLAAFVAAGYRTPLAAVAFVAETTGNPWTIIPAMLASVVSYMTMGKKSISENQRSRSGFSFGLSPPR